MRVANPRLDIDLGALAANYRRLASATPAAEAAVVVKCDAYGLGAIAVARTLIAEANCRTFFVAYSEEGAALRAAIGPEPQIFVFNGPFADTLEAYFDCRLTPVIYSLDQAKLWASAAPGSSAALHVDTGMNRLGLPLSDLAAARGTAGLVVDVVMSHLSCATASSASMNDRQRRDFEAAAALFPEARRSLSASGGALFGANYGFDMVRLGAGLYGVNPHDAPVAGLQAVATLTAPIIQLRDISPGDSVGYGATFTAKRPTRLATVSLGYGDGFPRAGSNSAVAHVGGALCPVAGRVSMDLTVLDITAAPEPLHIGDRAEFFGAHLSIDAAAAACGTIGYELLTGIGGLSRPRAGNGRLGARVEQRYVFDDAPVKPEFAGARGAVA